MSILNRENIKKSFPPIVFKRGLAYYNSESVTSVLYDKNNDIWNATVQGTESYFVELNINKFEEDVERFGFCECPAFHAYGYCKHIVAGLLEIADRLKLTSNDFKYEVSDQFIRALVTSGENPINIMSDRTPVVIEFTLKWDVEQQIYIQLKMGVDRLYVVKNVTDFLKNVFAGEIHYFTDNFTYDPEEHYILEQDMTILKYLQNILAGEQVYTSSNTPSYFRETSGARHVIVPPIAMKDLLNEIIKRNLVVEQGNQAYKALSVVENELPFSFSLEHDLNKELTLQMHDVEESVYFELYELLFSKGTFYFPTVSQVVVLKQLFQLGMMNHEFPIAQEQADTFLSEALPLLKDVGEVTVSEKVSSDIVEYPLRAKLYLEEKGGRIIGELEYFYGAYKVNPFNDHEEREVFIIRDVKKETLIMNLIEQANFRYNGVNLYLDIAEDEALYEFLYHILPRLNEELELFLTPDISDLMTEEDPIPITQVEVDNRSNLLEIGFTIDGVGEEEVQKILEAVIEKKRYYRMDSGSIVSLENDAYESVQQLFNDLKVNRGDLQDAQVTLPVYRGAQVDELIHTKKQYDPTFKKLLDQLQHPEEQVYELPENLEAELRDYQNVGYQWFKSLSHYHLGGILADDMGLGKTLQTIAYLLSEPSDRPHLVIVPSSVVYNWRNECKKFAPSLDIEMIVGTPAERMEIIKNSQDKDVWITSYGTIRQDISIYQELNFQTLILDEAQFIKNYATKTSQAIRKISASRKFALSGTPIENSVDELWAIFQVILPGLMPSLREFKKLEPVKISLMTKPFILRRLKSDVLKELPEKIESVHMSELTIEQKELYVGYLKEIQREATSSIDKEGFQANRMKILAGLTRLRQVCSHPSMFLENYEGRSGKMDELIESVQTFRENGKRMLIFSQFTSMHALIMEELDDLGIDYFYLDGQTNSEDRVKMSERFNAGEKDIFLISLKAGGTGLNLTGADTVILFDLWWNPAVEDQAAGRAHRFGQKEVVQVIRFITEGTIEEKIFELQQKKRELVSQIIQPGEQMLQSLTEDDIRNLLNI